MHTSLKVLALIGVLWASACVGGSDHPDEPLPLQYVGLDVRVPSAAFGAAPAQATAGQTSGVPPLGEAVSPVSGFPGDGAAVATQVGGWTGGPGAVRWHGGQWVMPYSLTPGSTLQNVSCDIWNPTTSAPANVLVEVVSSNGQVLGSTSLPASTSVVFRTWPFVGAHAVIDGEQLVVRISPKDATTGAWTTAAQDVTVIGCAVNAETNSQITVSPISFSSQPATWGFAVAPNSMTTTVSAILVGAVPVHAQDIIRSIMMPIRGHGTVTLAVKVSDQNMIETVIGSATLIVNNTSTWTALSADVTDTTIPLLGGLHLIISGSPADTSSWLSVGDVTTSYTPH